MTELNPANLSNQRTAQQIAGAFQDEKVKTDSPAPLTVPQDVVLQTAISNIIAIYAREGRGGVHVHVSQLIEVAMFNGCNLWCTAAGESVPNKSAAARLAGVHPRTFKKWGEPDE